MKSNKNKKTDKKLDIPRTGTNNPIILKLEESISTDIEAMPTLIKWHKIKGKVKKAEFDGLVAAGFTNDQAMELMK